LKKNPHILIAEDDTALAAILEEYLIDFGYNITIVNRGDDALDMLKNNHFDIVLSDIVMPGAGGLDVLAAACADPTKTLVLLMTGYSGIEDAIHAVEQGAYDFVSKPFQLPEIKVRIDNAARYQSLLRQFVHQKTYGIQVTSKESVSYHLSNEQQTNAGKKAYHMNSFVRHA